MSSILLLFAVTAVIMLALWVVRNDAPGLDGGDKGFFAMKETGVTPPQTQPVVRWRRR